MCRGALAGSLFIFLAVCLVAAHLHPWLVGRSGWGMFLLLQTLVAVSGILPAATAGMASGALFGLAFGFALASCSIFCGAMLAFALARSVFRPWVENFLRRRPGLQALDAAVAQDGWRSVALLRLSPVMPFALTSYALGLTSISWRNYLLGTLASLPALFGYAAIGHFAAAGLHLQHHSSDILKLTMLAFGAVATLWLTLHIGGLARRHLSPDRPGANHGHDWNHYKAR
jgi:uncharacterized membrane protein YdjX (TVP38/TMEM64 family)